MSATEVAARKTSQLNMLLLQIAVEVVVDYASIVLEITAGVNFDEIKGVGSFLAAVIGTAAVDNIIISTIIEEIPGAFFPDLLAMSSDEYEPWYYAVANGYNLRIFTDLDDALESTLHFSYSNWQKFASFDDAEEFLHANGVIVSRGGQRHNGEVTWTGYNVMDPDVEAIVAFCDGSALRNGCVDCTAAYAALFPHNQEWNKVKVLRDAYATSNRAEYSAALAVMRRAALADPNRTRPVIIFTDSELLINTMYVYIKKWKRNGWINASGGPVKNRDLIEGILHEAGGRTMMFRHVRAHTGRQEWEYDWNSKADYMAREAARNWDERNY